MLFCSIALENSSFVGGDIASYKSLVSLFGVVDVILQTLLVESLNFMMGMVVAMLWSRGDCFLGQLL
jgi:hypothetical protein